MNNKSVIYCCDKTMYTALQVSLHSLLSHFTGYVEIYISTDMSRSQWNSMLSRMKKFRLASFHRIEFQPTTFNGLPALNGSLCVYDRFIVPSQLQTERALYLDADTLIQWDLSPLFNMDMGDCAIGAVVDSTVLWSIDRDFRKSLGQYDDDQAFNSGVLLFDVQKWKANDYTLQCLDFAYKHKDKLRNVDQTVLNCLFHDRVASIHPLYNSPKRDAWVVHYQGNPKPWDFLGKQVVPNADLWYKEAELAGVKVSWSNMFRVPKILGGYKRAFNRFVQQS